MLNFLDKFLDNLAMWSIRGLVIIGVAFCVGFIWGVYDVRLWRIGEVSMWWPYDYVKA